MHFSLPKMCTFKYWRRVLRFSLPKNLHLSFSPLEWRWVHTFRCQKRCTFRNGSHSSHCQMAWLTGDRSSKANDRISGCTVLLFEFSPKKSKKWIKLIPKTIGNRKRDCAWGRAWGINTTWENLQIEKHKSGRRSFRSPNWFVLFDLQVFSGGVYSPSATSRTISFSISNSFWYYCYYYLRVQNFAFLGLRRFCGYIFAISWSRAKFCDFAKPKIKAQLWNPLA